MDCITASIDGRNKDLVKMAEKVLKKLVEKRGHTWRRVFRIAATKEEWLWQKSFETFGVDLRTRTKQLGAKEKARRHKCDVRFLLIRKIRRVGPNLGTG